jgi:hypothetical protein
MSGPFTVMAREKRRTHVDRYYQHLLAEDGLPCLETRTLPRREAALREEEGHAVRRSGPPLVDQAVFDRNFARDKPEPGLDERTMWALALARANRTESYGIDYKLRTRGWEPEGVHTVRTFVEIQELYHKRILLDALDAIGLRVPAGEPRRFTRVVVSLFGHIPRWLSDPLAFMAEASGVGAFRLLRDKGRELFADQPEVLARVDALLSRILSDEIGHVQFLRSVMGPVRMWILRRVFPLFLRAFFDDMPESVLMFGRENLIAAMVEADLDGAAAFESAPAR